ncbi:membrane-associated progesterone binding protein 3 [Actinidia rufa]|uniref:Membrane-associated progesterone binding protein 3 n=1 Tax=Actinidia rufa TaxID=165716 RepID=A0A7J0E5Z4_9ERIC|nr:membrane-associated progesterone binding protein 3 [Actinidia rufa]
MAYCILIPSMMFYGPGGPYALFAGKDASRALAKMSFEDTDLTGDISGLGPFELEALQDWEYKFMSKYVKVGTVKKTVPETDGLSATEPVEATDRDIDKPAENSPSENAAVGTAESTSSADAKQRVISSTDFDYSSWELAVREMSFHIQVYFQCSCNKLALMFRL